MKTILVPVDLAEDCSDALKYAIKVTEKIPHKLLFFHVTHPLVPTTTPTPVYGQMVQKNVADRCEELKKMVASVYAELQMTYDDERFNCVVEDGLFTPDCVIDAIEKHHVDMVIMDTHGASGLKKMLLGTNAAAVIERATCPVLAVPAGYQFREITKVAYASDLLALTKEMDQIIEFARIFDATVQIFHVHPVFPQKVDVRKVNNEELVAELTEYYKYDKICLYFVHTEDDNDTVSGVNIFVDEYKPSLIAMYTYGRSLFDRIFNSSRTEDVVFGTRVPLLALKEKYDKK